MLLVAFGAREGQRHFTLATTPLRLPKSDQSHLEARSSDSISQYKYAPTSGLQYPLEGFSYKKNSPQPFYQAIKKLLVLNTGQIDAVSAMAVL